LGVDSKNQLQLSILIMPKNTFQEGNEANAGGGVSAVASRQTKLIKAAGILRVAESIVDPPILSEIDEDGLLRYEYEAAEIGGEPLGSELSIRYKRLKDAMEEMKKYGVVEAELLSLAAKEEAIKKEFEEILKKLASKLDAIEKAKEGEVVEAESLNRATEKEEGFEEILKKLASKLDAKKDHFEKESLKLDAEEGIERIGKVFYKRHLESVVSGIDELKAKLNKDISFFAVIEVIELMIDDKSDSAELRLEAQKLIAKSLNTNISKSTLEEKLGDKKVIEEEVLSAAEALAAALNVAVTADAPPSASPKTSAPGLSMSKVLRSEDGRH
jgi:hypothetical protein